MSTTQNSATTSSMAPARAPPSYRTGPATKSPRGANAPQSPLVSSQLCGTHSWV
nr:MAG TPA: hypothetical protein [Caudoviricetes sp.]